MQKSLTDMQGIVIILSSRGKSGKNFEVDRVVTSSGRKCYDCGEAGHLKVLGQVEELHRTLQRMELQKLLSWSFENTTEAATQKSGGKLQKQLYAHLQQPNPSLKMQVNNRRGSEQYRGPPYFWAASQHAFFGILHQASNVMRAMHINLPEP